MRLLLVVLALSVSACFDIQPFKLRAGCSVCAAQESLACVNNGDGEAGGVATCDTRACDFDRATCLSRSDATLKLFLPFEGLAADVSAAPLALLPNDPGHLDAKGVGRFGEGLSFLAGGTPSLAAKTPGTKLAAQALPLTLEVWLKASRDIPNDSTIVEWSGTFELAISRVDSSTFLPTISIPKAGGNESLFPTGPLPFDAWYFLALVIDTSGVTVHILDGSGKSAPVARSFAVIVTPQAARDDLVIGNRTSANRPFVGVLDELRLWSTAKSAAEVCADSGGNGAACAY